MTREQKVKKRQERSLRRKLKRIKKDNEYYSTANNNYKSSISWGRKRYQGKIFICDMGYGDCEERGYCNGDC